MNNLLMRIIMGLICFLGKENTGENLNKKQKKKKIKDQLKGIYHWCQTKPILRSNRVGD